MNKRKRQVGPRLCEECKREMPKGERRYYEQWTGGFTCLDCKHHLGEVAVAVQSGSLLRVTGDRTA